MAPPRQDEESASAYILSTDHYHETDKKNIMISVHQESGISKPLIMADIFSACAVSH
jgi:hypothetical protein